MTDRELLERALDALEAAARTRRPELIKQAITALRAAIAEVEKQEPVACRTLCELCVKRGYDFCANAAKTAPIITTPPAAQRQPLIDSVRQMRDVQGMDGTWNCDPYMHGLYNGLEFAVSLLEQREPQFRDAPKKWLNDLPKPRIFSATEAAHGIGEKK